MGAAKEIEHLKKQIAELTASNENLAQSHSEGRFASTGRVARTMAHEIRNPLTNINLAVEQLISESPAAENTRFLFDMISRNCRPGQNERGFLKPLNQCGRGNGRKRRCRASISY